jgi:transcriptional regulator GlxA family with amidase domain
MISLPREERKSGIPPLSLRGTHTLRYLRHSKPFLKYSVDRRQETISEIEDHMRIAVLTFDGFNELDSFVASAILNRVKLPGWKAEITSPTSTVTSMNGVHIERQKPLSFAREADFVLIGSGIKTRDIARDEAVLRELDLDPQRQLIGAQCSGALLLSALGLLDGVPACTDTVTKPWAVEAGITVLEQPFHAVGNLATAGGCLASQYLAGWAIMRAAGRRHAEEVLHYVAPVGQKDEYLARAMSVIGGFEGPMVPGQSIPASRAS